MGAGRLQRKGKYITFPQSHCFGERDLELLCLVAAQSAQSILARQNIFAVAGQSVGHIFCAAHRDIGIDLEGESGHIAVPFGGLTLRYT